MTGARFRADESGALGRFPSNTASPSGLDRRAGRYLLRSSHAYGVYAFIRGFYVSFIRLFRRGFFFSHQGELPRIPQQGTLETARGNRLVVYNEVTSGQTEIGAVVCLQKNFFSF